MKLGVAVSRWVAVAGVLALVGAACSKDNNTTGGSGDSGGPHPVTSIGPGEGKLSLINWDGYVEPGWVKPFEAQTGCQVTSTVKTSSDDMYTAMTTQAGQYDGVSASGDATNRLIAAGAVAPIDVSLFPGFQEMMPALQSPPHNTVNGVHYGVPYMWGPNFLMYRTDVVKPAPTSWSVVFDPNSPYKGKITAYNSPIYLADAALYLKAHDPSLNITNPYELDQPQFDAAVALMQSIRPNIRNFWGGVGEETGPFKSGDLVVGTAWPVNLQTLLGENVPASSVVPSEGVTGWADTWMMSTEAPDPNCMLMWMNYTTTSKVQAQVAEFYGATPSSTASCAILTKDLGASVTNDVYHCGDQAYLEAVALWRTPLPDCGDSRGSTCVDYQTWTTKWTDITGG
jgi:putative spermidine/putrescine transport system substrate-binding protein